MPNDEFQSFFKSLPFIEIRLFMYDGDKLCSILETLLAICFILLTCKGTVFVTCVGDIQMTT